MLAGLGAGKFGSLAEAAKRFVNLAQTIMPDGSLAKSYEEQKEQYRLLYRGLMPWRRAQSQCEEVN
jgi:sugar (pentulose or hexulose) kinase